MGQMIGMVAKMSKYFSFGEFKLPISGEKFTGVKFKMRF